MTVMDITSRQDLSTGTLTVGSVLAGRYRLVARVGAGGMATIFRARDETLGRDVAIKVLHGHLAGDATLLERFRTEARHAASLLHPSVVNVFDQGVADLPYIVMEYIDGPSLREVLTDRGRLTPGEALAVIEPVCQALARAHASGLVHRDVKPENVLVAPDGTPKVADFGIARAVAETGHTQTGALIGSVHYLAPELVDGREATPASDQYAVGIMLFELLTGRKPLPADSPMAIAVRHARESVPAPSEFVSDSTRALDKVVARATALKAEKRYPDLLALVAALRAAVPGGPRPVTVTAGDGAEHTLVIPAEPVATAALPAARESQAKDTDGSPPPPRRRAGKPRRRPRRRRLVVALVTLLLLGAVAGGAFAAWNYLLAPVIGVPGIMGLPQSDAEAQLDALGLDLTVAGEEHHFDAPAGEVLSQDPGPGAQLRRGGSVAVVVSIGRAPAAMPSVLDMERDEAVELLESSGYRFEVRVDEEHSRTVPAGRVQAQNPEEGTELTQGDAVIINVSLGVRQVEVPDLSGMDRDDAESALADVGLGVEFTSEYSDEVPDADEVIRQSQEPGAVIDEGTVVGVTVSRGPLTVKVPKVTGDAVDEAVAEVEGAGFVAEVVSDRRPRWFAPSRVGRVEEQEPSAGTKRQRGSTVTLYTFSDD